MGRRTRRKSRPDYPEGVLGIYDNQGRAVDRFTVIFRPEECKGLQYYPGLAMSSDPFRPMGFCQHFELGFRYTGRSGEKILKFSDLPIDCQKAVSRELE